MPNMVTRQALELLEGWKSWGWEISEVPLYFCASDVVGRRKVSCMVQVCHKRVRKLQPIIVGVPLPDFPLSGAHRHHLEFTLRSTLG